MGLKDTVSDHEAQVITRSGEVPIGQVEEKADK